MTGEWMAMKCRQSCMVGHWLVALGTAHFDSGPVCAHLLRRKTKLVKLVQFVECAAFCLIMSAVVDYDPPPGG